MITEESKRMAKECYKCSHRRSVPGNAHIQCIKPDKFMTGNERGIENGLFNYPFLFDPTWKTKLCSNFEETE